MLQTGKLGTSLKCSQSVIWYQGIASTLRCDDKVVEKIGSFTCLFHAVQFPYINKHVYLFENQAMVSASACFTFSRISIVIFTNKTHCITFPEKLLKHFQ